MLRAFTLVELLVVVGIIVILVAIIVPSLESGADASKRTKCGSNLSAIGKALAGYVNDSPNNLYPVTTNFYMLLGQLGTAANHNDVNLHNVDNRPLNKYMGYSGNQAEVKVAQCPSDIGGQAVLDPTNNNNFLDDGANNQSMNVFASTGNSYIDAYGPVIGGRTVRTGIAFMFGPQPNQPHQAKPAASKVLVGDAPLHGQNKYATDPRNRWHESDPTQRRYNILFADSHVEFFRFPHTDKPTHPDNIERPIGNATADAKPQRGFW